ncbi:MAG: phosphoribosyltransferase [Ottowia sp.]|nr:phosphoribosyltransferase [Ottowia sp.]
MLSDDGKHLYVSNEEYDELIERLACKVAASGWTFDSVLCLARGGLRVGDIFSRIFGVPLAIMTTSSYREAHGTQQGELVMDKNITSRTPLAGRVLLADDLADSGATLSAVVPRLREDYPAITELRSAVLWVKASSTFTPDYCAEHLPTSPWIHQPFERYDGSSPEKFLAKWKGKF